MNVFHKVLSRTVGTLAAFLFLCVGIAQAQWVDVASFPSDRWAATGQYHNGKIYVFGGVTNGQLTTATSILDVAGSSWSSGPALTGSRYYASSGVANNKIYIFGGLVNSQSFSTAITSFDPASNQFAQAGTLPRGSWQAASVSVGSRIYVFGGVTVSNNQAIYTQSMLVFDAATGSITDVPNGAPYAGYNQAATVIGNTIYVVGGEGNGGLTTAFKGTVDGNGNISWTAIANLPAVVSRGAASSINGKLIVAGGVSAAEGYRGSYIYNEGTNTWAPYYLTPATAVYPIMKGDGQTPYLIGGSGNAKTWKGTEGAPVAVANYNQDAIFASLLPGGQTTQGVSITNGGVVGLQVSSTIPTNAQTWLSATNQTVAAGATTNYNFSINASSLAAGTYNTTVMLSTNDASNPTHEVNVYLYVGDPGVNQDSRVVFEEGSGDWCGFCPDGHRVMKTVEDQFGEKIIALSYHGGSGTEPLMVAEGPQIVSALGLPGWPSGSINRVRFPGESAPMVNRGSWASYIQQYLNSQPKALAQLEVEDYSFDPQTRIVSATVHVTASIWTAPEQLRLNVVTKQQGIFTTQVEYNTPSGTVTHPSYEQPNTVRHVWPNAVGQSFVPDAGQLAFGNVPPGTKMTQEVEFTLPQSTGTGGYAIKPEDCEIAFFVHVNDGTNYGPVLQGFQRDLEGEPVVGPAISVDWGNASQEIVAGGTATYSFTVTNNRSEPAQITINRSNVNLPAGWTSEICTSTTECDDANNVTFTIPGDGTHMFYLKVISANGEIGESGTLRLIIQGPGDFLADQTYETSSKTSSVAVPGEVGGLSMTSITPNPASSVARIDVSIPVGGETSLEIYTVGGEKVATLFEGRLEAGMRQINADVSALESGKYILVLKSGDTKVSRTMTIVR
ncbi:MAG: kelch repeat-containing protein [Candidatus Kapaibacterium sp.]